ncbi:MAG: hypothetical protein K2Y37_24120 [Pirellulales bacterium]|nr:hypothetical protein [Pirellulales bacterium]
MHQRLLICGIVLLLGGCGSVQLQRSTIRQARTLSDLQYQQVLDNLAMFSCNADALAWHLKIRGGLVQVTSQGVAGIAAQVLGAAELVPSAEASQAVVGQWDVDPTVEAGELKALQLAYQMALAPGHPTIVNNIYKQICETAVTQHVVPSREVTFNMLDNFMLWASPEKQNEIGVLKLHLKHVYDRIAELASRPTVQLHEIQPQQGSVSNVTEIEFLKQQAIGLLSSVCDLTYIPVYIERRPERNVAVIEQAQDKVEALYELVKPAAENGEPNPFLTQWVQHGCKRDIPPCVCYLGRYKGCQGDCYAWVPDSQQAVLRDFLLIVLRLAPGEKQDISVPGRGAAFSPGLVGVR